MVTHAEPLYGYATEAGMANATSSRPPFGSVRGRTMKLRCVVVENEERSLSRLKRILDTFPDDVKVIGEAVDGPTGVEVVRELTPDLLFLDIDLPGFNGFELLKRIPEPPIVVFTTAFNEHALQAFETHAVDYLVKPVDRAGVERSLNKLRALTFNRNQVTQALERILDLAGTRYLSRVSCKVGDRTILVETRDILYFRSDNKYTALHTATSEYLLDTPLIELEGRLNPEIFLRVHRSTLVNVEWIKEIHREFDGKVSVVLKDSAGTRLAASRQHAHTLRNL